MVVQSKEASGPIGASVDELDCRRAYYRVTGRLPIRVESLCEEELEAAIFDLVTPTRLLGAASPGKSEEESALFERLRRIEDKLDLLLGLTQPDRPEPLGSADLEWIVFSGSGVSLPVEFEFERGDWFRVEMLLPGSEARIVRGIGRAVDGAKPDLETGRFDLALSLEHMHDDDRDALVAHSYALQRSALRTRDAAEADAS